MMKPPYIRLAKRSVNLAADLSLSLVVFFTVLSLGSGHGHGHHSVNLDGGPDNKFHDARLVRDEQHIKEHLKEFTENVDESKMTPEELEFHYFKMHDFDNNTKLDGLEILAALTHAMPIEDDPDAKNPDGTLMDDRQRAVKRDEQLKLYTEIIDKVFEDDDFNKDGYLTYVEYVLARRRDEQQSTTTSPGQQRHH